MGIIKTEISAILVVMKVGRVQQAGPGTHGMSEPFRDWN